MTIADKIPEEKTSGNSDNLHGVNSINKEWWIVDPIPLKKAAWIQNGPQNMWNYEAFTEKVVALSVNIHLLTFKTDVAYDLENQGKNVIQIIENKKAKWIH